MPGVFAVIRTRGATWQSGEALERQVDWAGHAAFMNGLVKDGFVVLGGPLEGTDDVHARFATDPWASNGLLRVGRIAPWTLRLGSLER